MSEKVKVLFIGGWGRSGSTLLGNILGEVPGLVHVGELAYVWELGVLGNRMCGCGTPLRDCAWWTAAFHQAFGGFDESLARRMFALRRALPKHKHLPSVLMSRTGLRRYQAQQRAFLGPLSELYQGIQRAHAPRVIVDSSKAPFYALALAALPNVDLRILHLVRDPRATAHSWSKRFARSDGVKGKPEEMQTFSPTNNALKWAVWNLGLSAISKRLSVPSLRVRYEDFVREPVGVIDRILTFAGEAQRAAGFVDDRTVVLHEHHTAWGNPSRMRRGSVRISADQQWKGGMGLAEQAYLSSLMWPLLSSYGYPLHLRG